MKNDLVCFLALVLITLFVFSGCIQTNNTNNSSDTSNETITSENSIKNPPEEFTSETIEHADFSDDYNISQDAALDAVGHIASEYSNKFASKISASCLGVQKINNFYFYQVKIYSQSKETPELTSVIEYVLVEVNSGKVYRNTNKDAVGIDVWKLETKASV